MSKNTWSDTCAPTRAPQEKPPHPNCAGGTPASAVGEPRHDQARPKFDSGEAETSLGASYNGHTPCLLDEAGRDPYAVEISQVARNSRARFPALLHFLVPGGSVHAIRRQIRLGRAQSLLVGISALDWPARYHGPQPLRHREEVVERVGRLPHFMSQGEGKGAVEQAPDVGGVDDIVPHCVRVGQPKLLLDRLQGRVARPAYPQWLPGQFGSLLEALAI